MEEDLRTLRMWQEVDRNGYLASHVGSATNIFGVTRNNDHSQEDSMRRRGVGGGENSSSAGGVGSTSGAGAGAGDESENEGDSSVGGVNE